MPIGADREIFQKGGIFPEAEDLVHDMRPTNRGWGVQTYLYVEKQKYLNGVRGLSAAPALNPPLNWKLILSGPHRHKLPQVFSDFRLIF